MKTIYFLMSNHNNHTPYEVLKTYKSVFYDNGFKILLKVDIHLIIGEIEKIALLDSNRFLKTIKKLAQILACKKIIFNVSSNHWLYDILNNSLTPSESLPIGFYNIDSTFEFSEIQFSGADYDTF